MHKGPEYGLYLNPKKCVAYSEELTNLDSLDNDIIKDPNGLVLLGAALGNLSFVQEHADALVEKAIALLEKIRKLANSQMELVLTRSCASAAKLTYLLRTTPTHIILDAIRKFDDELSEQLNLIVGVNLPQDTRKLWALPITSGGFGFPECRDLGPIAFVASYNSARPIMESIGAQTLNPWLDSVTNISDVDLTNSNDNCQKTLKVKLDAILLERVNLSTSETRFKALMVNKDGKFASRWLSAIPSKWDNHAIEHRHFQSLLRFHSGLPFTLSLMKCGICNNLDTDRYGDHAISCPAEGGTIYRHDSLANAIFTFAKRSGIQAKLEVRNPLGTDKSRPGDVLLREWRNGKPLFLDVSVVNPLCPTYVKGSLKNPGSARKARVELKAKKYKELNINLTPMVVDIGMWTL